ncbi:MAG: aldose 1-epimerase family protein, partial [Bacteroidota bacterium]|nr:aldose 1-epimerase family protein [Bacteroidota bacterium]
MTFNLENDLISIKVNAVGAEPISLKTKENDLEFIWEADPEVWARHAPILFPIVGKLKDNTYNYNGIKYSLPQHGFARDKEFKLIGQDAQSITLQLQSDSETLL